MKLSPFFKIGKEILIKMVGVQNHLEFYLLNQREVFKDNGNYIHKNMTNDICIDCPLHMKNDSVIDDDALKYRNDYCINHCKKRKSYIQDKNMANNEGDRAIFVGKIRLSRLQLSQLLLYHALEVGPNGIVKNISENEIAAILGCTVRTVRNNNERLVDFGYILFSRISNDKFNILILDYNKYHLSSNEGGRGYVVMSNKSLMKLLNVKNVNALRIEIRNLVKFDDNNINRIRVRETSCTYKEVSSFLPDYVNYKAIIDRTIDETSGIFNIRQTNEKIYFTLKDEFNGKNERRKLGNEYKVYFESYCKRNYFNLTNKDYDDLAQMSLEYRFNIVIEALDIAYKEYYLKNIIVENYCGLVREIIKKKNKRKKVSINI